MRIAGFTGLSLSDFPGRVSALVFTRGCNYRCPFCHNRQILDSGVGTDLPEEDILDFLKCRRNFLDGVVITGGEPCIQEGLIDFCRLVKSLGVALKLDTNGSRPEILLALLSERLLDYVAMDIKAPLRKYESLCGKAVDTGAIRQSMKLLTRSPTKTEFRTTVVPTLLDKEDIFAIGELIQGQAPHYLQRYIRHHRVTKPMLNGSSPDIHSVQATLNERFGQTYVR